MGEIDPSTFSHDELKALQPHPFANLLPWIRDEARFAELVEDIRKNGLISPIVLFEGRILDGRNRHKAVVAAGIEWSFPHHFKTFNGTEAEALDYVESLNIHRRHLTPSQRAMAASTMAKLRGGRSSSSEANVRDVATAAGVSEFMVHSANRLRGRLPEHIIAFVEQGEVTIAAAQRVLDRKSVAQMKRLTTADAVNRAASLAGARRFKTWGEARILATLGELLAELEEREAASIDGAALEAFKQRVAQFKRQRELEPA